jgi:hypothetical protein
MRAAKVRDYRTPDDRELDHGGSVECGMLLEADTNRYVSGAWMKRDARRGKKQKRERVMVSR